MAAQEEIKDNPQITGECGRQVTPPPSMYAGIYREGLDVICDRGEHAKRFNEHYRILIQRFYPAYVGCSSDSLKRMLAQEIVSIIKTQGGKFYKEGKELTSQEAHKKVMKALKDSKRKDRPRVSQRQRREQQQQQRDHCNNEKKNNNEMTAGRTRKMPNSSNNKVGPKRPTPTDHGPFSASFSVSPPPPPLAPPPCNNVPPFTFGMPNSSKNKDEPKPPPPSYQRPFSNSLLVSVATALASPPCNNVPPCKNVPPFTFDISRADSISTFPEGSWGCFSRDVSGLSIFSGRVLSRDFSGLSCMAKTKSRERSDLMKLTDRESVVLADASSWE